ncbi:2-hydroxychromene-2-carboxylate isomerase [Parvibaculum sp.]|uniref:2-hydroxychromene-2-carboxylate isomerase n=1 Tax=Parvibaculum sp. TaxID=2024848 RepID=UPI0034A0957B
MTLSYDLFWSFRSPYSYLVTPRLVAFERDRDVKCNVRPVYPIAVRIEGFFKQVNPMWPPYLLKDTARIAEMEGLPYAWPSPDPIVMDMKTGVVPKEQPYIHRLTRAGALAAERGKGLAFLNEVSTLIFGGTKNWHEGNHLRGAAARAGLDMDELDEVAAREADRLEAVIAANEAAQKAAGHWGVPLMVFEGEPFFGQDRLSHLKWRMEQHGLKKRG